MFKFVKEFNVLVLLALICVARSEIPLDLFVIDGHNDLPNSLYTRVQNNLDKYDFMQNLTMDPFWGVQNCSDCHTDFPRMTEGRIGAQFWVAYTACNTQYRDAVARTLEQIDVIKRFVNRYKTILQFATSTDEITMARTEGKIASLIGVEGGHSIDSRLAVLRMLYDLGVRYLTLTHNCETPWADSNLVDLSTPVHNLTEFGRKVIKEMNRLGMIVDLSHVSHNVMNQAINSSVAPVIFSHSNAFSIANHQRNVHDDTLKLLKTNNGIIMIQFYSVFVSNHPENATIHDVIKHLNHIVDLIGIDHVGIGSDFNGVDSVAQGLEDVSKIPNLLIELQQQNSTRWTPQNLRKLASGNFLRVFKAVEDKRDELIQEEPLDEWISTDDLLKVKEWRKIQQCTSFLDKLAINFTNSDDSNISNSSNTSKNRSNSLIYKNFPFLSLTIVWLLLSASKLIN